MTIADIQYTIQKCLKRYTVIYMLHKKSEAIKKFEQYVELVKTQFGKKPKILRSDRGGKFTGKILKDFLANQGIIQQLTAPYSPQQNGVAERKNRTLVEMAKCMLIDAGLNECYWGEAINTANYLQNRLPSKTIEDTPYFRWFGRKPDLGHVRAFGTEVYCHVPSMHRGILHDKAVKLRLMGYSVESKAYRLIDTTTGKITKCRDVKFIELHNYQIPQPNLEK